MSPYYFVTRGLLALCAAVACSKSPNAPASPLPEATTDVAAPTAPTAPAASSSLPGFDPEPLANLVAKAKLEASPEAGAAPYRPRAVEVPPVRDFNDDVLSNLSANGVHLGQSSKLALSYKRTRDPITAAARCMELTTGCLQAADMQDGRDRDSCVASARTCETNHPWDEGEACCPERCQEFYRELRKLSYPDTQAWGLVRSSSCVPGMRELLQAAREADEAAKRAR